MLSRAYHAVAEWLADAVAAVRFREEAPQPLGRDILGNISRVKTRAGLLDSRIAEISCENLYGQMLCVVRRKLCEGHGYGISLLAGGATQRPDSDRLIRYTVIDDLWKDSLFQYREGFRVA